MQHSTERPLPKFFAILGYAVFSFVVLTALLELSSWAIWLATSRAPGDDQARSPAYAGTAWAHEFWQEEGLRRKSRHGYVPFLLWGVNNWHGKYINNDKDNTGVWRRTMNPKRDDCKEDQVAVWIFGGSTLYGTGVPDWATLPSFLSRDLNTATSDCIVVSNFGVEGYVSNQELILLMELLKAGGHPDIVIFYDGLNDAGEAGPWPGPPQPHFSFEMIKHRIEGSGRFDFVRDSYTLRLGGAIKVFFSRRHASQGVLGELHTKGVAALDNYEGNLSVAKALARGYNFRLYCFWQPSLYYGKKPLVPFEKRLADAAKDDPWSLVTAAVYQEAATRAASVASFIFLGDIFNSVQEPIYIDEGHLGPRGNELAAQAVAAYIQGYPKQRTAGRVTVQ